MTNHEYGIPAYDADKITEATIRARREVHEIVADLRKLGGAVEGRRRGRDRGADRRARGPADPGPLRRHGRRHRARERSTPTRSAG
jgi:hypothetical protein